MEGVMFAAKAWSDPGVKEANAMPDEASQRQFNKGYIDATLTLLCGRMDLDAALRRRPPQAEAEAIPDRRAA